MRICLRASNQRLEAARTHQMCQARPLDVAIHVLAFYSEPGNWPEQALRDKGEYARYALQAITERPLGDD